MALELLEMSFQGILINPSNNHHLLIQNTQ